LTDAGELRYSASEFRNSVVRPEREPVFQVSTALNLAIHSMAYLARSHPRGSVSAAAIAGDLHVSPSHLSKVLGALAGGGLIRSTRGARGGFVLERDPKQITLLDIVRAMSGPPPGGMCLLGQRICPPGACRLEDLRDRVATTIEEELGSINLARFAGSGPLGDPAATVRASSGIKRRRGSGGSR